MALLESERQPFITDPSNLDPTFERSCFRGPSHAMPRGLNLVGLLDTIETLGGARIARQRKTDAALAGFVSLHPAGFAVLDPAIVRTMPRDLAELALSAVVATIGCRAYPARRKGVARLHEVLSAARPRGHTLGGCRFIHWRERVLVMRELAHAEHPVRLAPGASIAFDGRYEAGLPPAGDHTLTIGYLGSIGVAPFDRRALHPKRAPLPRLLLGILPAAWDEDGIVSVPHLDYRRQGISALPRFVFRPANPLTQAGFAVV